MDRKTPYDLKVYTLKQVENKGRKAMNNMLIQSKVIRKSYAET